MRVNKDVYLFNFNILRFIIRISVKHVKKYYKIHMLLELK